MHIQKIQIDRIDTAHDRWHVRLHVRSRAVAELAASISAAGLLHPIIVAPARVGSDYDFDLVAGRQRLRACVEAGWKEIPARVMNLSDAEAARVSLAENLGQNGALRGLERGWAMTTLIDLRVREGLPVTQRALKEELGCSVGTVNAAKQLGERFPRARIAVLAERLEVAIKDLAVLHQGPLKTLAEANLPRSREEEVLELAARACIDGKPQKGAVHAALGIRQEAPPPVVNEEGKLTVRVNAALDELDSATAERLAKDLERAAAAVRSAVQPRSSETKPVQRLNGTKLKAALGRLLCWVWELVRRGKKAMSHA